MTSTNAAENRSRLSIPGLSTSVAVALSAVFSSPVLADKHEIRGYENLQRITPNDFLGTPNPKTPERDAQVQSFTGLASKTVAAPLGRGEQHHLADDDGGKVWRFMVERQSVRWSDVEFETVFSKTGSWWRDKKVPNEGLLQHEKGHIAITEVQTRALNAKKQQILERLQQVGVPAKFAVWDVPDTGQSEAEARQQVSQKLDQELVELALGAALRRVGLQEVEEWNRTQSTYETETNHGKNKTAQAKWNTRLAELLRVDLSEPEAESRSEETLRFESLSRILSFSDDFITALHPGSTADPIIGAAVTLPEFVLNGETPWGDPLFSALGDQTLTVSDGSTVFLTGRIPYLTYSGNTFGGVMASATMIDTSSDFVTQLQQLIESGNPFLLGLLIHPDADFRALTQGFAVSASTSFSNGIGPATPVPEPAMLLLSGIAAIGLARHRRRRRSME